MSESATTAYFNTVEHVSERGFRAVVGSCHKNIESAEQDLDSMKFRITALPKVCEALKLGLYALRAACYCMMPNARNQKCGCCEYVDKINEIFDDADVNK